MVFLLASSASHNRRHRRALIWPQISLQSVARAAQPSSSFLCSVSHCPTFLSFSPSSELLRQPHEARRFVCSFDLRRIDRPNQSVANCLQISKAGCVQSSQTNPATYTLERRLVALQNQNVAGVPTRRSLARRPPIAAGMAAQPGDNLQLPPAINFHLQASFDERTRAPHGHKTPPVKV